MDIQDKVKGIIKEQLGLDDDAVKMESKFVEDLGADSLDTVELVMAFEEEFGVEINEDAADKITTVQSAVDYITKNKT